MANTSEFRLLADEQVCKEFRLAVYHVMVAWHHLGKLEDCLEGEGWSPDQVASGDWGDLVDAYAGGREGAGDALMVQSHDIRIAIVEEIGEKLGGGSFVSERACTQFRLALYHTLVAWDWLGKVEATLVAAGWDDESVASADWQQAVDGFAHYGADSAHLPGSGALSLESTSIIEMVEEMLGSRE